MNELQLPPAPPLPDDVRERVLRNVLAGTRTPRRRLAPLIAAVLAVVATLALTTTVALSGVGGSAAQQDGPSPQDDPAVAEALGRCVAAVTGSELRGQYPPPAQWGITDVVPTPGDTLEKDDPGIALVINGSFVCNPDRYMIWVSSVGGEPLGAIEVAKLSGTEFVLFNRQRLAVEVGFDDGRIQTSTAAVQIISVSPFAVGGRARRVVVPGSYDGPLPDLENVAIGMNDRPVPQGSAQQEKELKLKAKQVRELEDCLMERLTHAVEANAGPPRTVLRREAYAGTPAAAVGRVGEMRAALCYLGPGGPVTADANLDPARASETRIVTSLRRDGLVLALLAVAPGVEQVEIATSPQPGSVGSGADCTIGEGLALCVLGADGPVGVRPVSGDGPGPVLPVP
jgi:hypothetical protein